MDYDGYPEYPQLHPPFEHAVTILDLLFHTGTEAPDVPEELQPKRIRDATVTASSARSGSYYSGKVVEQARRRGRRLELGGVAGAAIRAALEVVDRAKRPYSLVNDYGCGYGALVGSLDRRGRHVRLRGLRRLRGRCSTHARERSPATDVARSSTIRDAARARRLHGRERHLQRQARQRRGHLGAYVDDTIAPLDRLARGLRLQHADDATPTRS